MVKFPGYALYGIYRNIFVRQKIVISNGNIFYQRRAESSVHQKKQTGRLRKYVFSRYLQFVQDYGQKLETTFPAAIRVYRIFMVGIKDFYQDMKEYVRVARKVRHSHKGLQCLTRKEVELYIQMPKDMKKVAPILLFSTLPLTNYLILPMVYFFPRQLLCTHFWTLQQRVEFAIHYHRQRLYNYRPVFRALQAQLGNIKGHPLKKNWKHALSLLGSGVHPEPEEIITCLPLFCGSPYDLLHLYSNHVTALLRLHGMHVGWHRRQRLAQHACYIHGMDMAIIREGGPSQMSYEDMRQACFIRGLNPVNMKSDDIVIWLSDWLIVSKEIDENSWSLLLHCPVLLAYNQPSNWALLKS